MFVSQGKGGVILSAAKKEPEMHPLVEIGVSMAPYAVGLSALHAARYQPFSSGSNYSLFDVSQRMMRNLGEKTPLGFFNTFRIPEMMSPFVSPKAMGLELSDSVLDPSKKVAGFDMDSKFFKNTDSKNLLEQIVGEEEYKKISPFMIGEESKFKLRVEFDPKSRGPGRLIFEQLEEVIEAGEPKLQRKIGSAIDLGNARLAAGAYSADFLSYMEDLGKTPKMNPFIQGVYQNLDVPNIDYDKAFKSADGEILKFMPVPTTAGPVGSLGDLKRRTALASGQMSMGINRFNRLLSATFNQVPILGRTIEKAMDYNIPGIGNFSLKTKPGPFYKQFFSIGLKASKLGAAYMGLQTVDHYRRNFGVLGNLVASSATAGLGAYAYSKIGEAATKNKVMGVGAALFGSQMLLPGFNKGVMEGLATTGANIDIGLSMIGKYSGLSYYRRGIEGLLPGFTDVSTGLFIGLGVAAASYGRVGEEMLKRSALGKPNGADKFLGKLIPESIRSRIGFVSPSGSVKLTTATSTIKAETLLDILNPKMVKPGEYAESFNRYNPLAERISNLGLGDAKVVEYRKRLAEITQGVSPEKMTGEQIGKLKNFFNKNKDLFESIYTSDGRALDKGEVKIQRLDANYIIDQKIKSNIYEQRYSNNELNSSLLRRIEVINNKYQNAGFFENVLRRTEIFGAEMYHSFFGATMEGDVIFKDPTTGDIVESTYKKASETLRASPIVKRFGALVLGTAFVHKVVTGGLFGSMEDPQDLVDEYAGRKLVEVKAGRFWEAGGTPYEGGKTTYFRPSLYSSFMSNAAEKSVWGDDAERFNPISKFLLKNFTYHLEEKNYYDRPYPITSAAFKDIPVIGDILAQTIGRVIKPPKLMHQDELVQTTPDGQRKILYKQDYGSTLDTGAPRQKPISPYNFASFYGSMQYQTRELEGLPGFIKQTIQDKFTGSKYVGTKNLLMAESMQMDSSVRDFWDMELGGFGFLSEPVRRLFPRERSEIEYYNPIANAMPSYLPSKFKKGDPYRLIKQGFARLPGAGYEALNPDVKGLDPEDYPDIHKYKILSDVAPKSRMTMKLREQLMERRAAGITTKKENKMLDDITGYHQKRLAATRNFKNKNAIETPLLSDITAPIYSGGTNLIRKIMSPGEQAIPGLLGFGFRPSAKLLGRTRSAIEVYETERLYGTANAFWDKPLRDSFRPAIYSLANLMGYDGKPYHVQQKEELNEQFDKIQFLKFMKLAESAENLKDKNRYLGLAAQTRTGVNPNGDALSIYLALPNAEKQFFDAFSKAQGSERERILEMVPEDQQHLYRSVWSRMDSGEAVSLFSGSKAQIDLDYMNEKFHELEGYFNENPLPSADWIGWHKDVDVEDVKVKYVQNLGAEIHDYDMWESQMRRGSRKPYLETSDLFMYEAPGYNSSNMYEQVGMRMAKGLINTSGVQFEPSRAEIFYNDDRKNELNYMISEALRG